MPTTARHTLTIQEESFTRCYPEIACYLPAYFAESSCLRDTAVCDFDTLHYATLEYTGSLLTLTVRTPEGTLVGFFNAVISMHPHAKEARCAFSDLFYLDPQYRGGMGTRLLKAIREACRAHNVAHLLLATTLGRDLDAWYQRAGLTPFERVYYQFLGRE